MKLRRTPKTIVKKQDKATTVPASRTSVNVKALSTDAAAAEAKSLYPLVLNIVRKSFKGIGEARLEYQDIVAQGLLALVKAIRSFDGSKGAKLSTHAHLRVSWAIKDLVAAQTKYAVGLDLVDPQVFDEQPVENTAETQLNNRLLFLKVIRAIETKLPPQEAVVLVRLYLEEVSEQAISRELKIPTKRVRDLHAAALSKLKAYFDHSTTPSGTWLY